jgi:PleD family two-component response regulator
LACLVFRKAALDGLDGPLRRRGALRLPTRHPPLEEARQIAERILDAIRAIEATAVDGHGVHVTASRGVAETKGQDAGSPGFIQRVRDMVRAAKKAGKYRATG